MPSVVNDLYAPVIVAIAYYLGCQIGFWLRFPPATTSILWPPNSILTAAFLLLPPRRWWICLLFVFPAHLLVELQAGFPLPLVLTLYVTNCSEALLAAGIVRWLSDAPDRFDTLRRVVALVVGAVIVSPLVTTFADAAAVALLQGELYWIVWWRRLPSNALAGLTVLPAAVSVASAGFAWIQGASWRRKAEAAAISIALIAVGSVVFASPSERAFILPGAPYTSLSFLLPFLLWSAVRFGPAGASLSLLATVLLASWAATRGLHPLGTLPATESPFAMQVFLLVVGIPLTFVAALMEDKRQVELALRENLHFERMLSEISGAFVHHGSHQLDSALEGTLVRLGESMRVDRVVLFKLDADLRAVRGKWSWTSPELEQRVGLESKHGDDFLASHFLETRAVGRLEPSYPAREGGALESESYLFQPLVVNGRLLGGLAVLTARPRQVPNDLAQRLQLVGAVLANAIARDHAETEVRRTRDELAHSLRVSTMGVLASSLAHELNQPLGAIMANAETALARVDDGSVSPEELREILSDVVADDRRAGDVIARIRGLLRKGESRQVCFDVNDLVRDVSYLLRSDAAAHDVRLELLLETRPPFIYA
ncbi:MAG: MASE1 domain-containing protein, partial [Vicinamibacteria bacterium]